MLNVHPSPVLPALTGLSKDDLTALMADWDQPASRAGQILDWIRKKQAGSFDGMTNLPAALREKLAGTHSRMVPL